MAKKEGSGVHTIKKQIVIMVTGKDAPGITFQLTEILNHHQPSGVKLLDIEQAVTHGLLSLSMLIEFTTQTTSITEVTRNDGNHDAAILKDLLFKAKELGVDLDFFVVEGENVLRSSSQQFAITLMSDDLQAKHISAVAAVLAKRNVNIDSIRKLNERGLSCLELITYTNSKIDVAALKDELLHIAARFTKLDIAVQKENLYRRSKRLVVMDMDSTLIQIEVIDELAKLNGVGKKVEAITEKAMLGEMEFDEALRARVKLLKGLKETKLKELAKNIPLTVGAEVLIKTLQKLGYKIALVSGGFSYFGDYFKNKLDLDYVFTNTLEIKNGVLTGNVLGEIVNAERKAQVLEEIAKKEHISLESVIAIGDGANDIPMLKKAGLGIAFNAKQKAREAASASINQKAISAILYLLGITDKDIEAVCS